MSATATIPAGSAALVAGGGGGVGQSVARMLLGQGFVPVLLGRTISRLEAAVRELGGDAGYVVGDVTDRESVEQAVRDATAKAGPVLVLVNAAGIAESAPLLPPDDTLWHRTMDVNATGAWHLSTACLPAMKAAGAGFVCHVASTAAIKGYRYTAAYVASKHAVLGLARALAQDLRSSGIRVSTVCPGFLDTPMTDRTIANMVEATGMDEAAARATLAEMNASGRLIGPDEVADAIRALLEDPEAHGREVTIE